MISFGRHICNDFNVAIEKEWLMTNKKGSYASSTILMTNTRKHHGLLVAKLQGMDNRVVIFPNCDEEVELSGHIYHISTHKYRETIFPKGFAYLENFSLKDDVAVFLYLIDNVRLKKEIYLMKTAYKAIYSIQGSRTPFKGNAGFLPGYYQYFG
jgi:predicted glycogen debranching enzyme